MYVSARVKSVWACHIIQFCFMVKWDERCDSLYPPVLINVEVVTHGLSTYALIYPLRPVQTRLPSSPHGQLLQPFELLTACSILESRDTI